MLKPGDYVAPTGKLIQFNTLDCNKAALERSLKFYDPQLYLKWNPKKRAGWGMWEVRRKPEFLSKVYAGTFEGTKLYKLEHKESDIIHHVLDVPVLHYDLLGKIKRMDTWGTKDWVSDMDYVAATSQEKERAKARAELQYNIKQYKSEWRELAAQIRSGVNPSRFLKGIKG